MGLGPGYSSSCNNHPKEHRIVIDVKESPANYNDLRREIDEIKQSLSKNPNPNQFTILNAYQYDERYLLVQLRYNGCTNFEGKKILVYEFNDQCPNLDAFYKLKTLDPHFCDKDCFSPIARFVPTKQGQQMAVKFIKAMLNV